MTTEPVGTDAESYWGDENDVGDGEERRPLEGEDG